PADRLKPSARPLRPSSSCTAARALHAAHHSSQRLMPAVTSSKSVSGTPAEMKRGAQWCIAISTRLSFVAVVVIQNNLHLVAAVYSALAPESLTILPSFTTSDRI